MNPAAARPILAFGRRRALPRLRSLEALRLMADFVSKASRKRIMASIRSKGNETTELKLAAVLRRHALTGWRRHAPLPGTPDFVWPAAKVALFVDGCFWHGCPRHYKAPTTRSEFWATKVKFNRRRDLRVTRRLRAMGWSTLRVWECQVLASSTLSRLRAALGEPPLRDGRGGAGS